MGEENAVTVIKAGEMLHCNDSMNRTYNFYSNFLLNTCISALVNTWDRFREKGPNAYIIKFPVRNVTVAWLIKNSEPYNSMTDTPIFSA